MLFSVVSVVVVLLFVVFVCGSWFLLFLFLWCPVVGFVVVCFGLLCLCFLCL